MTDLTVPCAILEQLGGFRFTAMTGATNMVGSSNSISFKIKKFAGVPVNHVTIKLEADDTYTVTFTAVRGLDVKTIKECHQVYADNLRSTFEQVTGLRTSLGV